MCKARKGPDLIGKSGCLGRCLVGEGVWQSRAEKGSRWIRRVQMSIAPEQLRLGPSGRRQRRERGDDSKPAAVRSEGVPRHAGSVWLGRRRRRRTALAKRPAGYGALPWNHPVLCCLAVSAASLPYRANQTWNRQRPDRVPPSAGWRVSGEQSLAPTDHQALHHPQLSDLRHRWPWQSHSRLV